MRPFFFIVTLIVALHAVHAQERPLFTNAVCDQFVTDSQGDLYLWKNTTLNKYDGRESHHHLYHYDNPRLGAITTVDVTIPTKVLVFYQESGALVFLDNRLTPISQPLNLFEKGFNTITLAAVLGPSALVLFDEANQTLHIVDYELNNINTIVCNIFEGFQPTMILTDADQRIVLIDTKKGFCTFDRYGTLEKQVRTHSITSAQLFHHELWYLQDGMIFRGGILTTPELYLDHLGDIQSFQKTVTTLYQLKSDGHILFTSTEK